MISKMHVVKATKCYKSPCFTDCNELMLQRVSKKLMLQTFQSDDV